jgi:hypothetical protein
MVIREDLEREENPAAGEGGASERSPAVKRNSPRGDSEAPGAGLPMAGFQKCPYLAGRPPCGTHHMFPSGTNVCWANPREEKPYRGISRETQADRCFGGAEGLADCELYQQALAEALPLPRFEPPQPERSAESEWIIPDEHRPRHRRREEEKRRARLMFYASWAAPLILSLLLLGLLFR